MYKWILPLLFMIIADARDYVIFSIAQEFPMSPEHTSLIKNYYVNIGSNQGVGKDTELDVFRIISRVDPYGTTKRYNYKVKIGTLKVLHAEESSAVAIMSKAHKQTENLYLEVPSAMIGDHIAVKVED